MAYVPDCDECAVKEVAQVYERIKIQQPFLLLHYSSQLAQNLLSEALRGLNIALSVMNQQPASSAVSVTKKQIIKAAEAQLSSPSPAAAAADSSATTSTARRGKRRRSSVNEGKNSSSWVNLTSMPYEDGYEWRKYGEKKINGTTYTRSYFRCTYKDDTGCMATKHIQQKDNNDPPMFQVTYNNDHSCNCNTTTAKRNNSNNNPPFLGYFNGEAGAINPPNNGGHTSIVKQEEEPQQLQPLLAESCAALPLDQTTLQGPHHANQLVYVTATLSAHHHAGVPSTSSSTDSSCITGLSCDECPGDMAAVEPAAENDPIRDLEHFLMYDIDNL